MLVFGFIATRYPDPVRVLLVHCDSARTPVYVVFHLPDLCLDRRPEWACGHPLVSIFYHPRGVNYAIQCVREHGRCCI